jgi:hypothetical protein
VTRSGTKCLGVRVVEKEVAYFVSDELHWVIDYANIFPDGKIPFILYLGALFPL